MKNGLGIALIASLFNIGLYGCGGKEDKSILEPLSADERMELIQKDVDYALVFALIDVTERSGTPLTSSATKTIKPLTYRRLNDFMKRWSHGEELEAKRAKYENEWTTMFESYALKADSASEHWREYLEQYKPGNYVDVELIDITDKENVFFGEVKALLRLTPKNGSTISGVRGYYSIGGSMEGRNRLNITESFSSPKVIKVPLLFNYAFDLDASKVNELPVEQLIEIYPFDTRLESVAVDGKTIEYIDGYFKIPSSIRDLWAKEPAKGKEWKSDYDRTSYYERVIWDLIEPDMPSQPTYVQDKIRAEAYADDELAAYFYYEVAR